MRMSPHLSQGVVLCCCVVWSVVVWVWVCLCVCVSVCLGACVSVLFKGTSVVWFENCLGAGQSRPARTPIEPGGKNHGRRCP